MIVDPKSGEIKDLGFKPEDYHYSLSLFLSISLTHTRTHARTHSLSLSLTHTLR